MRINNKMNNMSYPPFDILFDFIKNCNIEYNILLIIIILILKLNFFNYFDAVE